jgi:hypothetical protein
MKCESVSFECRKFFEGILVMEIPKELPIYLVDKGEMRRLRSGGTSIEIEVSEL